MGDGVENGLDLGKHISGHQQRPSVDQKQQQRQQVTHHSAGKGKVQSLNFQFLSCHATLSPSRIHCVLITKSPPIGCQRPSITSQGYAKLRFHNNSIRSQSQTDDED